MIFLSVSSKTRLMTTLPMILVFILVISVQRVVGDRYENGLQLLKQSKFAEAAEQLQQGYWDILNSEGSMKEKEDRALACMHAAMRALNETKGPSEAARFLDKQAWFAGISGGAANAISRFNTGLATAKADYPKGHHIIAAWYHAIAYLEMMRGSQNTAVYGFKKAADMREAALGITHELVEMSINSLAYAYQTHPKAHSDVSYIQSAARILVEFGQRLRVLGHSKLAAEWFVRVQEDTIAFRMGTLNAWTALAYIEWIKAMRDVKRDLIEVQQGLQIYNADRRAMLSQMVRSRSGAAGGGGPADRRLDYSKLLRDYIRLSEANGMDADTAVMMMAEEGILQVMLGSPSTAVSWLRDALKRDAGKRATVSDVFMGQVNIFLAYALAEVPTVDVELVDRRDGEVTELFKTGIALIEKVNGSADPDVMDARKALTDLGAGRTLQYMTSTAAPKVNGEHTTDRKNEVDVEVQVQLEPTQEEENGVVAKGNYGGNLGGGDGGGGDSENGHGGGAGFHRGSDVNGHVVDFRVHSADVEDKHF